MRILICNWKDLAHPAAGGAEVYTHECARRWVGWGHEVTQISAAVAGRPAIEVRDGVRILRHGSRLGVYGAVKRFLRGNAHRFDVIVDEINTRPFFAHQAVSSGVAGVGRSGRGPTPVVALAYQVAREVWAHETPMAVALVGRYVLEPRWLPAYAEVPTITISQSSAQSLERYGLRNLHLVPIGVEPDLEPALGQASGPAPSAPTPLGPKAEDPTLVFCGRMVSMKRPGDAIAAFGAARHLLGERARLQMIGTGPLEGALRAAAPDGVEFLGRVSEQEKYRLMARAHVLLATSVREGWGLVVSEAAAVGTPTIAYDVDGLRDSVRAGRGVLVPEHPEALAEAIGYWVPRFQARPPAPLPNGGADTWDNVAKAVLEVLAAQLPRPRLARAA